MIREKTHSKKLNQRAKKKEDRSYKSTHSQEPLREWDVNCEKSLFENMFDGVAVYKAEKDGEDFVIVEFNKAAERISAVQRNSVIGRSVLKAFPGIRDFGLFEVFQRVYLTGKPERYPLALYEDEMISRWTENSVYKLPSGEIVAIFRDETDRKRAEDDLIRAHDDLERRIEERTVKLLESTKSLEREISERKQVEAALRDSNLWLSNMLNSLEEAVLVVTPDRKFININKATTIMFGYSKEEIEKLSTEVFHVDEEHYIEFGRLIEDAFKLEKRANFEFKAKRKNGEIFPTEHTVSLLKNENKKAIGIVSVVRDISERRKAEKALKESEENFRALAENANDGILIAGGDGLHLYVNKRASEISGYKIPELLKMHFGKLAHPNELKRLEKRFNKRLKGEQVPSFYETLIVRKDGNAMPIELTAAKTTWQGKPADLVIIRDISERKRKEIELRESEERFRAIFLESPIGIRIYDSQGLLLNSNKSANEVFGLPNSEKYEASILFKEPFVSDSALGKIKKMESIKYEYSLDIEKKLPHHLSNSSDSGSVHLSVLITPLIPKETKSFCGYLVQIQNISDRKRYEKYIQSLTQRLMKIQETERQRISRDLHDNVAQNLSILKMDLESLIDIQHSAPAELPQKVLKLSESFQETITAVRDLSYGLLPPSLDHLGLVRTIFQYCGDFSEKHGMDIDFNSAGLDEIELDFDTEIHLYRIIQEALVNILKHAQASHIVVKLVASFPKIILRVRDDGIGFDMKKRLEIAEMEKRMGLRSIEQRVRLLHGKVEVQSQPNRGTNILVEIPYVGKTNGSKEKHIDHR